MRINTNYALILLLIISANFYSQEVTGQNNSSLLNHFECKQISCSRKIDLESEQDIILKAPIIIRPYNVLSYKLFMDWRKPLLTNNVKGEQEFSGINEIELILDSTDVNEIEIDALSLTIDSIFIDSELQNDVSQPEDGILKVQFSSFIEKGDIVNLKIFYHRHSGAGLTGGIYLNNAGDKRQLYTKSEPIYARMWMPCNDNPHDKAIASISIRVPNGFLAVSNGLLKQFDTLDDSKIFHWSDSVPIATYLMAAAASKFMKTTYWYHRRTNPTDSIEVQFYTWQEDIGHIDSAFGKTPKMMDVFSDKFCEYPFDKYGTLTLEPFVTGGMEHQTVTFVARDWLPYPWEEGVAHELAHQWIGDYITCGTWNDIWINEGGASWAESLWLESQWGLTEYFHHMWIFKTVYLQSGYIDTAIYGRPINDVFNVPLSYYKSSWIYHMLRTMLGDEVFFNALRNLFKRYSFNSLTTEQFKESFKLDVPNPPVSLDTFFNQWIYKAGHPKYSIKQVLTGIDNNQYYLKVNIKQLQTGNNITEVFQMPLKLLFLKDGEPLYTDTVVMNQRAQDFNFTLDFLPDTVSIDDIFVLCEVQTTPTDVTESIRNDKEFYISEVSANPLIKGENGQLLIWLKTPVDVSIGIYDITSKKIMDIFKGILTTGNNSINIETNNLSSGFYSIIIKLHGKTINRKFFIIK